MQAGILRENAEPIWERSPDESGKAVFVLTQRCLESAGLPFSAIGGFIYCEGPGSMLGIRTVAMAIRTWQAAAAAPVPAYRYQSLTLVAQELKRRGTPAPFAVIADARRDSWHAVSVTADCNSLLQRIESAALAMRSDPLFQPAGFRAWTPPPREVRETPYDVGAMFAAHADEGLFDEAAAPDAFQYEAPEYKKWTAQVHTRPQPAPQLESKIRNRDSKIP